MSDRSKKKPPADEGRLDRRVGRLVPKRAEAGAQWKQEFALLEKAFNCEIEAAINKTGLHLMQTKATKLADKMVEDGLLRKVDTTLRGGPFTVYVQGYELTHAGRLAYCCECA